MWTYIFFALFFGTFIALLVVLNTLTRRISELERQRIELQVEEDRVFDFLHGLGEAFSEGVRSSELHRLIVESATRILDAHGGALYLMDKADAVLAPAFVSKGCPALLDVPKHILEQAASNHVALESYLRLSPVRRGEGPIGHALETGQARIYSEAQLAETLPADNLIAHSAIVGPLVYRRKILGVLGLANGPMSTPFSEKDLTVFKAITEQSAFALYNEVVYIEAGEKSASITTWKSPAKSKPSCCPPRRRWWKATNSAASTFPRGRSAAIISTTSGWMNTAWAWPSPMSPERACPPRSSWPCAAA